MAIQHSKGVAYGKVYIINYRSALSGKITYTMNDQFVFNVLGNLIHVYPIRIVL